MRFLPLLAFLFSCHATQSGSLNSEPQIVAQAQEESKPLARVQLSGPVDGNSAAEVIDGLLSAERAGAEAVLLEIDTPGGGVKSGFYISKTIEDLKIPVICVVDGEADSMGFYILQSCDVRLMTYRSVLMAHEPAFGEGPGGHPNEMRSWADALKVLSAAMVEHMSARMTCSAEEMAAKIEGGRMWWFDWHDALQFHAVDGVVISVHAVERAYPDGPQGSQWIDQD